ncbi:TPA: hypothetical protein VAR13_002109 [Streptococcus agalactiae]|nr:hypothetical protein [Streptococcus agalactiae]
MGFEPKNKEIRRALEESSQTVITKKSLPKAISVETKKQYQFMLKPSNHKKLKRIAGRSMSAYLDLLIESLPED